MTISGAPHDWSRYSLSDMWKMLSPQSRADGHVGVLMWQQVQDLCRDQADQLETALAKLREAWPLSQPAANAFQAWTAEWVTAMRATSANAKTNGPIIDSIVHEIDAARNKVAGLVDDATRYENMNPAIADLQYFAQHAAHGDLSLIGWREGLTNQAHAIMANLEQQIAGYAVGIATEQPFTPSKGGRELPAQGPSLLLAGSSNASLPGFASVEVMPGGMGTANPTQGNSNDGGASGGGQTDQAGTSETLLANIPMLDSITGLPGSSWPGGVGLGGSFVDTPAGRVLAPGGLIGAPIGATSPGDSALATVAAQSGMMPLVPPITSGSGAIGTGGAASKGAGKRRSRRRTVPAIFEVGQGGPDVIVPFDEPDDHDPGPNVFGIDL
jgi:hypothetical protein